MQIHPVFLVLLASATSILASPPVSYNLLPARDCKKP